MKSTHRSDYGPSTISQIAIDIGAIFALTTVLSVYIWLTIRIVSGIFML